MATIAPPSPLNPLERRLLEALYFGPVLWNEARRLVLNMDPGPVITGMRYRYNLTIRTMRLPAGDGTYCWGYVLRGNRTDVVRLLGTAPKRSHP